MRRLIADELILSFVPNGEQRSWRNMTRMKTQLTRDRVRLQNQMECLLQEMRIKLSRVVSDLLGGSGLRILQALAQGETDPKKLAVLGDQQLQCSEEQLVDALTGSSQPMHREMLALQLERLPLIDTQIEKLTGMIAQAVKAAPRDGDPTRGSAWFRSGFGAAGNLGSGSTGRHISLSGGVDLLGGGTCSGKDESAEQNHSSRSAKGNKYLRRVLNQAAHAAVKKTAVTFKRCSGVCCLDWAINPPSGQSPIGSVAWRGRSCMRGFDLSSKAPNLILRLRSNAPACWREPFASSGTRSQSHP